MQPKERVEIEEGGLNSPAAGRLRHPLGSKPLLMVDVDGVLSLFGFPVHDPPAGRWHSIEGIPHFLSAVAARHLLALAPLYELVWCSGWEEKADEHLPRLLGLPRGLAHLRFERSARGSEEPTSSGNARIGGREPGRPSTEAAAGKSRHGHWKLATIDAYAGARPLAWIDDCIDAACHAWAAARSAPTLLVHTAPARGLTEEESARLRAWAPRAGRA